MKLRRKNTYFLEWGSNPWKYIFRAEFFVRFLVQMKTAKSPFEINWPLASIMLFMWTNNGNLFRIFTLHENNFREFKRKHVKLWSCLPPPTPSAGNEAVSVGQPLNWVAMTFSISVHYVSDMDDTRASADNQDIHDTIRSTPSSSRASHVLAST